MSRTRKILTAIMLLGAGAIVLFFSYKGSSMAGWILGIVWVIIWAVIIAGVDGELSDDDDDDDFNGLVQEQRNLHSGPYKNWIP